jgi:CTP synthase (UTP-ammonia lyase)
MGYRRDMPTTRIALVGDKDLRYVTHRALDATLAQLPAGVEAEWVATDGPRARELDRFDGIWMAPGTPYRDGDAALAAIERSLDGGTPLLGTCGGFQYVVLALARRVAGLADAAHAELDPEAPDPVVAPLACSLIEQEREVTCVLGTRLAAICGTAPFTGFHYCSHGLADGFVERLEETGVVISAHAEDAGVEGLELPDHPFFVATLFQPQIGALSGAPLHPLIAAFVEEAGRVRVES